MIQTKDKVIDGLQVSVTQFPARVGFRIQAKIISIIGGSIGELVSAANVKSIRSIVDTEVSPALGAAFGRLLEKAAMELTDDFIDLLLSCTTINGKEATRQDVFDNTFSGRYDTLYKVLFFVLEVNFGSFLSLLPATGNTKTK